VCVCVCTCRIKPRVRVTVEVSCQYSRQQCVIGHGQFSVVATVLSGLPDVFPAATQNYVTVVAMISISALTLSVGRQEEYPACKN